MKPFDQELYDQDDDAKHKVIEWLGKHKVPSYVNPDKYGIDLLTESGYGVEVEVKHNWTGPKFPYGEVHFSVRKYKFAKPNTFLTMLNHERDHILVVTGQAVFEAPTIHKRTKYTRWESFVEIPISECRIYDMSKRSRTLIIP